MKSDRLLDAKEFEAVVARQAERVAYSVYAVGLLALLSAGEWALWKQLVQDFPGWRPVALLFAVILIGASLRLICRWSARLIASQRFGGA